MATMPTSVRISAKADTTPAVISSVRLSTSFVILDMILPISLLSK